MATDTPAHTIQPVVSAHRRRGALPQTYAVKNADDVTVAIVRHRTGLWSLCGKGMHTAFPSRICKTGTQYLSFKTVAQLRHWVKSGDAANYLR